MTSPSLVDQRDLSEIDTELTAANRMKLHVDGAVILTCHIGKYSYDLACLISPDIQDVIILGASWLQQHQCVWDFAKSRLWLHGREVKVIRLHHPRQCRVLNMKNVTPVRTVPLSAEEEVTQR